jgi:phage terminase large subunit-like protein
VNHIGVRVYGFKTTARDKTFRLGTLEVPGKNGNIYIHRSMVGTDGYEELKRQWTLFPNLSHDDVLDAVELLGSKLSKGGFGAKVVDKRRLFG